MLTLEIYSFTMFDLPKKHQKDIEFLRVFKSSRKLLKHN